MINSVTLVGRAGADPEMKYFTSGAVVTTINIALSRPGKEKGSYETDWVTVKFWSKTAETAGQYIKKGHLFGVIGELQQETWNTESGDKRSKLVVVGRQLKLMQPKGSGDSTKESDDDIVDIFGAGEEIPF